MKLNSLIAGAFCVLLLMAAQNVSAQDNALPPPDREGPTLPAPDREGSSITAPDRETSVIPAPSLPERAPPPPTPPPASPAPPPPGYNPGNSIALSNATWYNGTISTSTEVDWYTFTASAGTTYYVWWNVKYSGSGQTADIEVSASNSSGTAISGVSEVDSGWTTPKTISGISGRIYLKVAPYSSSTGTYAIAYRTTNTRP
jgi:hypothetical protein